MNGNYTNPHQKLQQQVDKKLKASDLSPELSKVKDNLVFINEIAKDPVEKDTHSELVFGVKRVDPLSVVFGDNIWNRSIFTVDALCDMYDSATLQQRLKYQKQKRRMDSKMGFILILIVAAVVCCLFIVFALGVFG